MNSILNHSKHESNRLNDFIMKTNQSITEFQKKFLLNNQTRQESIKDLNESKNLINEIKNKTIEEILSKKFELFYICFDFLCH